MKNITKRKIVTFVFGTRPEAIKMAPVIKKFQEDKFFFTRVILTGQHKEIVNDVMKLFGISEDLNLNLMIEGQSLNYVTCKVLSGLKKEFSDFYPSLVLVQGDTTSALAAALAAFYEKIPIGHIEAGLRTNDLNNPFPEEANRRIISQISNLHFAPTKQAKHNLISSNVKGTIEVTGNTVIDSFLHIANSKNSKFEFEHQDYFDKKYLFVTIHRRENWGPPLIEIVRSLKLLLERNKDLFLVLPMHPNKIVRKPILEILQDCDRAILIEPLKYDELVQVVKNCYLILTDSGGLQEEAPSLNKPVLILRETTEREEAVDAGTAKLVGYSKELIISETESLLFNKKSYEEMSNAVNPFGNGSASNYILDACKDFFV